VARCAKSSGAREDGRDGLRRDVLLRRRMARLFSAVGLIGVYAPTTRHQDIYSGTRSFPLTETLPFSSTSIVAPSATVPYVFPLTVSFPSLSSAEVAPD
jgi:hypothetical protein